MALRATGSWFLQQQVQMVDDSPLMTRDAVHGQIRNSLTSLAEDPYWQQKRDKRKSSLQQKGNLGFSRLSEAGVSASPASYEVTALSQTYQSIGKVAAKESAHYASHCEVEDSIAALHMPSRTSRQAAVPWDGGGQADHEAPGASSLQLHSRQGSTVRFAVEGALMPSGPKLSTNVPEVHSTAKD